MSDHVGVCVWGEDPSQSSQTRHKQTGISGPEPNSIQWDIKENPPNCLRLTYSPVIQVFSHQLPNWFTYKAIFILVKQVWFIKLWLTAILSTETIIQIPTLSPLYRLPLLAPASFTMVTQDASVMMSPSHTWKHLTITSSPSDKPQSPSIERLQSQSGNATANQTSFLKQAQQHSHWRVFNSFHP